MKEVLCKLVCWLNNDRHDASARQLGQSAAGRSQEPWGMVSRQSPLEIRSPWLPVGNLVLSHIREGLAERFAIWRKK
jgi:hypothetical protein